MCYYAEHGKDFRILSSVASQVFVAEATSGETELIASDAGIYYRKRRNSFKPETVKKMIFLQGCFLQDMPQLRRAKVANERVQELIKKQSLSCQINRNGPSEDFIEFLNGLCSWIYYDEDEANFCFAALYFSCSDPPPCPRDTIFTPALSWPYRKSYYRSPITGLTQNYILYYPLLSST